MSWIGKKAADVVTSGQQLANGTITAIKLAAGAVVAHLGYTPVNKAGDSITGRFTVTTGGADGIVLGTDTQDSTTSSRLFLANSSIAASIYYDNNGLAINTGAALGSTSGTKRFGIDLGGRVTMPSQPAFIAFMGSTSTATTIPFNNTSLNRGGNFNTGTYTFTAPVAGLYFFNLIITFDGSGTNPNANFICLQVNGGRARDLFEANPSWSTNTEWHSSCIYYLNANDAVTIGNGGSASIQGGGNTNYYSLFSGHLIG